jgi:hypothetical protein
LLKGFRLYPSSLEEEELQVQTTGFCSSCGEDVITDPESLEVVCIGCGRVWGRSTAEDRIPFEESGVDSGHSEQHWNPEGRLVYGKNLGVHQTLEDLDIARILGGKRGGNEDLNRSLIHCTMPMAYKRALQVKRVKLDHPQVMRLLKLGSELCKKHGLKEKGNEAFERFAQQVGINLRYAGSWCIAYGKPWADPSLFAASIFTAEFRKHYPDRYMQIRTKIAEEDLELQKLKAQAQIVDGVDMLPKLEAKLEARKEKLLKDGMRAKYPEFCLSEAMLKYHAILVKVSGALELPEI